MKLARYIDREWHHYCVRDRHVQNTLYTDEDEFADCKSDKKFSYLQDFDATYESLAALEARIRKHIALSDHVYVGLGEPLVMYKDQVKHGWDHEHNVPDGPHYYTDDFINRFSKNDPVTFFANLISHVRLNRPMHYLNDMFFQGNDIYRTFDICRSLLGKLSQSFDKQYHWEMMCSHNTRLYDILKKHEADSVTFSTCHALGVTHWGPDVVRPSDGKSGAQSIAEDHNLRCSDLIDPSIYNQSHYSCVVETVIPSDNRMSMFSEKEAKPIVAKRPFIIVGTMHHLKAFRDLGFKTFSPVIDESYDDEPDFEKRTHMVLDSMLKLSREDPEKVYQKLRPVLDHNHNHFYNNEWNQELQEAWYQGRLKRKAGMARSMEGQSWQCHTILKSKI
jgi:hypothetical protein